MSSASNNPQDYTTGATSVAGAHPGENTKGQGVSHASNPAQSSVPESVQRKVPAAVEDKLPDSLHDTGSNSKTGKISHATGDSKVPLKVQEAVPAKLEKILPNSIHDTRGADI